MAARRQQLLVGLGTLGLALVLALGATQISSVAGYAGIGPNFLPWVVSSALAVCGGLLCWRAWRGGWRDLEAPDGAESGHWVGFAWVSAALLASAALITTIGFILSCTLCFVLAVRGFRSAQGRADFTVMGLIADAATGVAISAPVYWLFARLLAINLPSLTATGWL